MPISLDWDPERRIWTFAATSFSLEEVADLVDKHDFYGAKRFLWDLRDLHTAPRSGEDVRRGAGLLSSSRALWEGSRAAIVVSRDLDFGIARMFQALSEGLGVEYQVFRDVAAATGWLSVGDPGSAG